MTSPADAPTISPLAVEYLSPAHVEKASAARLDPGVVASQALALLTSVDKDGDPAQFDAFRIEWAVDTVIAVHEAARRKV